jgi:hypothetical protein
VGASPGAASSAGGASGYAVRLDGGSVTSTQGGTEPNLQGTMR